MLHIRYRLRDKNRFGTNTYAAHQGNLPRIMPHYLNKKQSIMRIGSVPNLIHSLNNGIYSSIITYCIISSREVIINGTGNSDKWNRTILVKIFCRPESSISSNCYYPIKL